MEQAFSGILSQNFQARAATPGLFFVRLREGPARAGLFSSSQGKHPVAAGILVSKAARGVCNPPTGP